MRYDYLTRKARQLLDLPNGRVKHFSFLLQKKKIVGFGYNQSFTSHPIAKKYGYRFEGIHSELHCLLSFCRPLREVGDYVMVNVRFMADGSLGIAKPCNRCQKLLRDLGLLEVVYSTENGYLSLKLR